MNNLDLKMYIFVSNNQYSIFNTQFSIPDGCKIENMI